MKQHAERVVSRAGNAVRMLRDNGLGEVITRLFKGQKRNVFSHFAFLSQQETAASSTRLDVSPNTVNWVIPAFAAGSGGHINSLRFIAMLVERGYLCRIIVDAGPWIGSSKEVGIRLRKAFGPVDAEVHVGVKTAPASFAAVATGWEQAHSVRNAMKARERFYFVQDFEPWFCAHGSEYHFAEDTYRFGFTGITAGNWLAVKLRSEYGMTCYPTGFSYDKQVYGPGPRTPHVGHRVFFYARPSTERRGFELGLLALNRLCAMVPDVTVVFAGADLSRYTIPFRHESLGSVSVGQLPELYRSCDIALVISMTNLSLLPLELMACGIPVVSNAGPWTEWLLQRSSVVLAETNVPALSDAMHSVLTDEAERIRVGAAGMAFAATTSWEREGDAMAAALASRGCVPMR